MNGCIFLILLYDCTSSTYALKIFSTEVCNLQHTLFVCVHSHSYEMQYLFDFQLPLTPATMNEHKKPA